MKKLLFLLILFLPSCAMKHHGLGEVTGPPVLTETLFIAADGHKHALSSWVPQDSPWAVIVALHGFNDYRMAFKLPGEYFAKHGVLVLAYDQRGFGQDIKAGFWPKKEALKSDALAMLALARGRYPDLPIYLMGESMGGALALYTLAERDTPASGAILVAPGVWHWQLVNLILKPALWLSANLISGKKISDQTLDFESSDNIDVLSAMSEDPFVRKKTRMDAIYGLARIARHGMKAAPGIRVPIFLIYGKNDDLVPTKISRKLWDKLPTGLKTQKHYQDGYHLLLRDCQAGMVWNDILAFLAENTGHEITFGDPEPLCQPALSSE